MENHFAKSGSWALESQRREQRARTVAWTVAGIAAGVAALEAVALAMLSPLKTVEPVTLLVDRQTGYVQALDPLHPLPVTADAALTQSLLAQYVMARESFEPATLQDNYRKVGLWSSGAARASYLREMAKSQPDSRINTVPAGTSIQTEVKSVSLMERGGALVRFDTAMIDRNGNARPTGSWIALVKFAFVNAGMRFDDRLMNPLGLQVSSYRRDAEVPEVRFTAPVEGTADAAIAGVPVRSIAAQGSAPVADEVP